MSIKRAIYILTIILALPSALQAQEEPEYRMEIGGGIGMMTYIGDFNSGLFASGSTSTAGSIILKRVINPYMGVKFNVTYGKLKGSSSNIDDYFPDISSAGPQEGGTAHYEFSNTLVDIGATYEYNFWPYGTGRDYRGAKRVTPFIFIGLGATYCKGDNGWIDYASSDNLDKFPYDKGNSVFTLNMPLGVGVKYKVADRLNLSLDWGMHFCLSDKLDGVKDPLRINSTGLFKNTDCYSMLQLSLTYSFSEKCKTCMNSDW